MLEEMGCWMEKIKINIEIYNKNIYPVFHKMLIELEHFSLSIINKTLLVRIVGIHIIIIIIKVNLCNAVL